jgi:hypothetical protein
MTQIQQMLEAEEFETGMGYLVQFLKDQRLRLSVDKSFVYSEVLTHPIRSLMHKDPFTYRAFSKPYGYPGDAVILDYVYGCGVGRNVSFEDTVSKGIYTYTTGAPAPRAVRFRRNLIAQTIDRLAETIPHPLRILSIAAGHLREAEISKAIREKRIGEFIALDRDENCCKIIAQEYSQFGVSAVQGSVRQLLTGKHKIEDFDFVYAAGLFDYLTQSIGKRLVQVMFHALRKNGEMLIANYATDTHDVGYMESFMDWYLIYRNDDAVLDLLSLIPKDKMNEVILSHDPDKNIGNYLPPSPAFLGENKSQSQLNTLPPRFRTVEIPA